MDSTRQPIVLIISSDPVKLRPILACLNEAGYQVVESIGEQNIPRLLAQVKPNLVLLDWELRNHGVLALIGSIRSNRCFKKVPIILAGREIGRENMILSLEAGADLCIEGTILPMEFIARVRAVLRRAGTGMA